MTKQEIFGFIVDKVELYSGITFTEIIMQNHSWKYSQPRQVLCYLLYRFMSMTQKELSPIVWRNRATISYSIRLITERLSMDFYNNSEEMIYCKRIIDEINEKIQ